MCQIREDEFWAKLLNMNCPTSSLSVYVFKFYVTVEPISYNTPTQTATANATNIISDALGYKQQPALMKNSLKT